MRFADPALSLVASVNEAAFAVDQTLNVTVEATSPELAGNVDGYAGLLSPDNSIQFFTSTGIAVGNLNDLASFRPLVTEVRLEAPFSVRVRDFYSHTLTGREPRGTWVFFIAMLNARALAGGSIPDA